MVFNGSEKSYSSIIMDHHDTCFIKLLFHIVVVVPLQVPVDESPLFRLYQDCAFGLIFLKIWKKLVLPGQMDSNCAKGVKL